MFVGSGVCECGSVELFEVACPKELHLRIASLEAQPSSGCVALPQPSYSTLEKLPDQTAGQQHQLDTLFTQLPFFLYQIDLPIKFS